MSEVIQTKSLSYTQNGSTYQIKGLPPVTSSDNNKILQVANGAWDTTTLGNASSSAAGLMSTADKTKLDGISGNVYSDYSVTIETTDWTLDNNVYTYTWTHSSVTYSCLVDILFITQPDTVLTGVLSYDKVSGGLQFTSTTLPTGDLSMKVRIIDSDTTWVIQQQNAFIDLDITLQASSWSNSSPYVQTWTSDKITDTCDVKVKFLEGALAASQLYIGYEKVSGGLQFTAPTKPTVNIPIRIHIINADPTAMENLDAEMVSTDAVSGAVNVQEALEAVDGKIGTLSSLTTSAKSNAVAAVNEINSKLANKVSLGHITGSETTHEARLADIISRITTNSNFTQFSCTYFYNGSWLYEGYVYPNKDYGGGTIVSYDDHVVVWKLVAGIISVYDETDKISEIAGYGLTYGVSSLSELQTSISNKVLNMIDGSAAHFGFVCDAAFDIFPNGGVYNGFIHKSNAQVYQFDGISVSGEDVSVVYNWGNWTVKSLNNNLQQHDIGTFTTVAECKQAIINHIINIPTLNCVRFQVNGTEILPEPLGASSVFAVVIPVFISSLGSQDAWFQMIATNSIGGHLTTIAYRGNNVFYYNDFNGHSGTF